MKINYLFSRKNKIGSRLIAWASGFEDLCLEKCPSHIAVLLDDNLVVESTLTTGVRMLPYSHWAKINEELYRVPCFAKFRQSKLTIEKATRIWGKRYDWKGIAFFAISFIKLIVFKQKLPDSNPWQSDDKYFCTEYAGSLTGEDYSMMSPAKLCDTWRKGSFE